MVSVILDKAITNRSYSALYQTPLQSGQGAATPYAKMLAHAFEHYQKARRSALETGGKQPTTSSFKRLSGELRGEIMYRQMAVQPVLPPAVLFVLQPIVTQSIVEPASTSSGRRLSFQIEQTELIHLKTMADLAWMGTDKETTLALLPGAKSLYEWEGGKLHLLDRSLMDSIGASDPILKSLREVGKGLSDAIRALEMLSNELRGVIGV